MKIIKYILVAVLFVTVIGCKIDVTDAESIFNNGKPATLEIRSTSGLAFKKTIQPESEAYKWVLNWLKENETGWHRNYASIMHSCVIRKDNFSLNFVNDLAVLEYTNKEGKYLQLTKSVEQSEYSLLLEQKGI